MITKRKTRLYVINIDLSAHLGYNGRQFPVSVGGLTPASAMLKLNTLTIPSGMQVELSFLLHGQQHCINGVTSYGKNGAVCVIFYRLMHGLVEAVQQPPETTRTVTGDCGRSTTPRLF